MCALNDSTHEYSCEYNITEPNSIQNDTELDKHAILLEGQLLRRGPGGGPPTQGLLRQHFDLTSCGVSACILDACINTYG